MLSGYCEQISTDFVTGFEKLFFHPKALQTRMQIEENNFFVVQVVPDIYAKSTSLKKLDVFFLLLTVLHLILLCYLGDAIRCVVSSDSKMVARHPPMDYRFNQNKPSGA